MKQTSSTCVWAFVFCAFLISSAFGQDEVIEKRQKLMKSNSAAAKALKAAVESKDYATVQTKAKEIGSDAGQIADLFPKGSTSDKSRAKAEIWEKWDAFTKDASQLRMSASELAEAAAAKDDARVKAKFDEMGKACSSCHKPFRAEKKS